MQSEVSRLLEWLDETERSVLAYPYEIHMAKLELESLVEDWTEVRTIAH